MKKILFSLALVLTLVLAAALIIGCGAGTAGTGGTTAADTTAPTVSSVTPTSGATSVATTSAVSVVFSEAMDSGTISASSFTLSSASGSVSGSVSYTAASKTATFTPSSNLSYSTTYTATIAATAADASSNTLGTAYTWSFTTTAAPAAVFTLTSVFNSGEAIPADYCGTATERLNVSIPLSWSNAPSGTLSFALSILDLSSTPANFVHWLVTDIPPTTSSLAAGASSSGMPSGSDQYTNDYLDSTPGYGGPYPPTGETHTYQITIYALNVASASFTNDTAGNNLAAFNAAIAGKVLEQASMTGTFLGP